MLFETNHGVIVACDVDTLEAFEELIRQTHHIEGIVGYKVGTTLGLTYGLRSLTDVVAEHCSLPVIYDHQKAATDIPQMAEPFAQVCKNGGVDSVILFPQAGPETEKAFIKAVIGHDMEPMVGGEMTHPGYLASEQGYLRSDAPPDMYRLAAEHDVRYLIVPGNRPTALQRYHDLLTGLIDKPAFCMPGIGRQGGSITDAFKQLGYAAKYAIVGSAIYRSDDPAAAARELAREALAFE